MRRILSTTLGLVLGFAASAQAATTPLEALAEYQASLASNFKDMGAFLAEPVGKGLAFATGSQSFSPVAARHLLGFNIGLFAGAGTTAIDKSGAKSAAKQGGTDVTAWANSLPDSLPIPLAGLNAHVGLPAFLFFESTDLGLRLYGLNVSADKTRIALNGFGADLRGNVFEAGLTTPVTLTLGLSVDQLKTEIRGVTKDQALNTQYSTYTLTGTVEQDVDMDSQITALGLKATVSRKVLFLTPYAGVGLQALSGDTSITARQKGAFTATGPGGSATLPMTIEGKGTKPAPGVDVRLAAGLEVEIMVLYLALGGEYGVVSGGSGGSVQLGVQF